MSRSVTTGSVDQSIQFWAFDADGAAVTGEAYNSAGMAVSVVVRLAGRILSTTALTLVARSGVGVHTDSSLTEVSGGEYVVDLPDSYLETSDRDISLTVASTAITGTVIVGTLAVGKHAELDSTARFKLDASQPDYAPATASALSDLQVDVDANTGYLTSLTSALSTLAAKVRKYFQLSLRKDAAIATDNATELGEINANGGTGAGAFANTTDSNEAIRDRGDAAWTTGSGGGSGSLTQEDLNAIIAGVQAVHLNITEAVENCGLTITKGDTWIQDIDGLGDLSTKRITFALKADRRDADSAAIVFIDESDGLTYLNGAVAGTPGDGAIEIIDEGLGNIRIRLESSATKLIPTGKYVDAVKAIKDNADFTLRNNGTTTVVYGVIQEIS